MPHHSLWKILPPAPVTYVADIPFCSPIISHLLYNRGIKNAGEAKSFLNPEVQILADPFLLPDMDKAILRIMQALESQEKIAVWGDFDTDGISGTALLVEGLSLLGAQVTAYIPRRIEEGYGLNINGIETLKQNGVKLIVTVDCGTGAISEVDFAQEVGIEVIITDHHTVHSHLPQAQAVINPRREDSHYPFAELAGVGVALKLIQALAQTMQKTDIIDALLELVALGTVTDMMPLNGENRYLVKRGLEILNYTQRIGLKALMSSAGLQPGQLDTESISYSLGPRLNTLGRFRHALPAYQLLVTQNTAEARKLAKELEQQNTERKLITEKVWQKAREKVMANGANDLILFTDDEDYHPGVLGLVAGKLVNEFYRPAIVIKTEAEICRGSARSIAPFNFVKALTLCQDLLIQFGGHAMAAGFTITNSKISQLYYRLCEIARGQLTERDLQPKLYIDAEIQLSDLNEEVIRFWRKLAPFGSSNNDPTFLSRGIIVKDYHSVGQKKEHLQFKLHDRGIYWSGIAFNMGQYAGNVTDRLDIVYQLATDHWNGRDRLRLNIIDFVPAK